MLGRYKVSGEGTTISFTSGPTAGLTCAGASTSEQRPRGSKLGRLLSAHDEHRLDDHSVDQHCVARSSCHCRLPVTVTAASCHCRALSSPPTCHYRLTVTAALSPPLTYRLPATLRSQGKVAQSVVTKLDGCYHPTHNEWSGPNNWVPYIFSFWGEWAQASSAAV